MVITTIDPAQAADYLANIKKDAERTRNKGTALQKNLAVYTITPKSTMTLSDVASATSLGTPETFEIVDNKSFLAAYVPFQLSMEDTMNGLTPTLQFGTEQYREGPRLSKTKYLKAFDFTGADQVNFTHSSLDSSSFTWMGWVTFDQLRTQGLILTTDGTNIIRVFMNGLNRIEFDGFTAAQSEIGNLVTAVLVKDRWYHWAVTWDNTPKNMKLYLNGVKVAEALAITNPLINPTAAKQISGTITNRLDGGQDDVQFWNSALSDADILNAAKGKQVNKDTTVTQPATIGFSDVT